MSISDVAPQETVEMAVLRIAKDKRGISFARLAADSGIPESTIRSYSKGVNGLGWAHAKSLMRVLPADLGSLLIEETGYCLAPIDGGEDEGWDAIGAEASQLTHEIFEARKDRRITPREDAKLKDRTRQLIAKAQRAVAS
jgi:transcriptional regulator with XRE-family HTH domain